MTIIIGTLSNNKVYIGADTLYTWERSFVRECKTSKFLDTGIPDLLVAGSGQDKFSQVFTKVIQSHPELAQFKNRDQLEELVSKLYDKVEELGVGDAEHNELPEHDMSFMLANKATKRIWVLESDYSIFEFDDHACIGSGYAMGEAAMKVLSKVNVVGEEALKLAIATVNQIHPYCGGAVEIREISWEDK